MKPQGGSSDGSRSGSVNSCALASPMMTRATALGYEASGTTEDDGSRGDLDRDRFLAPRTQPGHARASPEPPSIAAHIFRWWSSTAHLEELSPRCTQRP
jgi:hypothetical protein